MNIKLKDITGNPANPRTIRDKSFQDLKRSIAQFPQMLEKRPIAVIKDAGKWVAIGGNQRTKALVDLQRDIQDGDFADRYKAEPEAVALLTGYFTKGVPCVDCTDLTADQQRRFIIADNLPFGEWDTDALANEWDVDELQEWGMPDFVFGGDMSNGQNKDVSEIEEGVADDPNKITVDVAKGDIFEIGNHRIMCGDSGSIEDIKLLLNGKVADMSFTDPPYGVSYTGKTKDAMTIENDDLSDSELEDGVKKWFDGVDFAVKNGGYLLATVPARPLHLIFAKDWKDRGWLRQIMVWNKSSMVLGHSEYHYKHEPILFGWKQGGERLKNADRTKTTVWDFDKPNANRDHPTMKPVSMWAYGIQNHSNIGDIVYEPFSGGGTCLDACEEISRICYAMEIDPRYCQVAVNRMHRKYPSLLIKKNGVPYTPVLDQTP